MATEAERSITVGRLAPSPTGALHLGNARSFLLAWLSCRQQAGRLVLRIEDIDSPRIKAGSIESTIEDLRWLGLDWDAGPDPGQAGVSETESAIHESSYVQSQRLDRYRMVLQELIDAHIVYPCVCSRSDVATAASAPHADDDLLEGPVYPGTCRRRQLDASTLQQYAWRFQFRDAPSGWFDELHGAMEANPAKQLGDFVIAKGNGTPAYQLAVVVDDHDMGVTEVIRGDDLIYSTFRQVAILNHLGWPQPRYYHVPLVVGPDGRRLAKRHGDTRISCLRKAGIAAEAIVGYLAHTAGLIPQLESRTSQSLIGLLDWKKISRAPTIFSLESGLPALKRITHRH